MCGPFSESPVPEPLKISPVGAVLKPPGAARVLIAPGSTRTCNKNNTAMPLEREKANSSDVFSENRTFVSRT